MFISSKNLWFLVFAISVSVPNFILGQEHRVNSVTVRTNQNLTVELWVSNPNVSFGRDLKLYLKISNKGNKEIYLVKKNEIEIESSRGRILIESPMPYPIEKDEFDYRFVKIMPKSSHSDYFTIPANKVNELGDMTIFVGLGFVQSTSGIDKALAFGEKPFSIRRKLADRMKTFGIGEIEINVLDKKYNALTVK